MENYARLTIETLKTAIYEQVDTGSFNEVAIQDAILKLKVGIDTAEVTGVSTTELTQFVRDLEFVLYDVNI